MLLTENGIGWTERYLGGSEDAEQALINRWALDIQQVQARNTWKSRTATAMRAFHAKMLGGFTNAQLHIASNLPDHFNLGFLKPGKVYRTDVRFSNASGLIQPDTAKDLRGAALRVHASLDGSYPAVPGMTHDLLMTNAAANHVRDAYQFMTFGKIMAGFNVPFAPNLIDSLVNKAFLLPRLAYNFGPRETLRILKTASSQVKRYVASLTSEYFYSRGPISIDQRAVKFRLAPCNTGAIQRAKGPDYLRNDLALRLNEEPVAFDFQVQLWLNEEATPIEDSTVEWTSAFVTIGRLVIPQQDMFSNIYAAEALKVDNMEFNPWVTTGDFRPLGSLNRARRLVYRASAQMRRNGK